MKLSNDAAYVQFGL